MVKKRLKGGAACQKCDQAEKHLAQRGLLDSVDRVVWAEEGNADSEGMRLAEQYGVLHAPFFLLEADDAVQVETSVVRVAKLLQEHLIATGPGALVSNAALSGNAAA